MEVGRRLGMSQIETASQNCSHSYACNVPDRRLWFPMVDKTRTWVAREWGGSLRVRLVILCAISAICTAIALIPGILVLAIFLVIPAIILILAPYVFVISVAFLIGDRLSPQTRFVRRAVTAGWVMAGVLLALVAAAGWYNRPIEQQVRALTQQDHDLQGTLAGTRNIAIQVVTNERGRSKSKRLKNVDGQILPHDDNALSGQIPPPSRKQFCERLCLHLLFDGLADTVLISSVSAHDGDPSPPDLTEIGMRFHLDHAPCRNPPIKTDDTVAPPFRLFEWGAEQGFAEEISARMIAGQCVIGEPARLSEAQVIVQENAFLLPSDSVSNYPLMKNALHLNFPPKSAARLSIYRVQDGSVEEMFRETEVEAYPLLPVLLLGPVPTGEGGIGITEGFLRQHQFYSKYSVRDVLKSKVGMDIVPISRN